jgi:hypothetical protein
MKDPLSRRFFLEPQQPLHRRDEALRAVFVDQQPQTEVAERFGYTYNTMRRLVSDFRAQCRANQVPPFSWPRSTDDLPDNIVSRHQLARTLPSLRMRVGCRGLQAVVYAPAWPVFSCFSRCWPRCSLTNSSPKQASPARGWCPPPAPCSVCSP